MNAGHIKTTDFHTRAGVKKKSFCKAKTEKSFSEYVQQEEDYLDVCSTQLQGYG